MKVCMGGLLAAVLLSATFLSATSISDPGVKLGGGTTYVPYAEVVSLQNGDFELLFDGQPFTFSNPFTAPNCFMLDGGGFQCNFENVSGVDITSLTQAFVTGFDPGQLTCLNAYVNPTTPGEGCSVDGVNNNVVNFTGFSVPTT